MDEQTYHFTESQLRKLLAETISMYVDYRRQYDWTPDKVVQEVIEGLDADRELSQLGECKPSQIIMPERALKVIAQYVKMKGNTL